MSQQTEAQTVIENTQPFMNMARGNLVAVNNNYTISDLEISDFGRNRARGVLKTPSLNDFKSYVLDSNPYRHEDEIIIAYAAPVFVDHKNVSATAILNYKVAKFAQGHCDHKAILQLEQTVVWKKVQQIKDNKLDQRTFATFLEDWSSVFTAFNADNEVINAGVAISAVRNMKVDASVKAESVVNNTSESRSVFEKVEAQTNVGKLPAFFTIKDSAFIGLDEKEITLRLIVNAGNNSPEFKLQIVKEDLLNNEIIEEFKNKVIALLPENPVRIGTFTA